MDKFKNVTYLIMSQLKKNTKKIINLVCLSQHEGVITLPVSIFFYEILYVYSEIIDNRDNRPT